MGALAGSLSYLRFFVQGEVGKNPGSTYEKSLEARRFLPLNPADDILETAGWVPLDGPFDDGAAITRDRFLFGDLLCVTYREDRFAIPRAVIKRETARRVQKIIDEEKKDPDEISRAFLKAVEQAVFAELKKNTLPRSKLVDVVWDFKRQEVRAFGRGTAVTERLASLFERTFQVRIEVAHYPARAFSLDLGSRAHSVLERLSPGWLFPDAMQKELDEARERLSDGDAPHKELN